jgi:hypothetical protein
MKKITHTMPHLMGTKKLLTKTAAEQEIEEIISRDFN